MIGKSAGKHCLRRDVLLLNCYCTVSNNHLQSLLVLKLHRAILRFLCRVDRISIEKPSQTLYRLEGTTQYLFWAAMQHFEEDKPNPNTANNATFLWTTHLDLFTELNLICIIALTPDTYCLFSFGRNATLCLRGLHGIVQTEHNRTARDLGS